MGGAGVEGFVPAVCPVDPQDGAEDAGVGDSNAQEGAGLYKAAEGEEQHLAGARAGAGELQQWGNVTEEMVDYIGAAERQRECERCVHQRGQTPAEISPSYHGGADPAGHGNGVDERMTYGHVAVVGHRSQNEALRIGEGSKEKHL